MNKLLQGAFLGGMILQGAYAGKDLFYDRPIAEAKAYEMSLAEVDAYMLGDISEAYMRKRIYQLGTKIQNKESFDAIQFAMNSATKNKK